MAVKYYLEKPTIIISYYFGIEKNVVK